MLGCAEGPFLEDSRGGSNPVALLEMFLRDNAVLVDQERAGIGDAELLIAGLDPIKRVLFDQVLVQESERSNRLAALIGKQRKLTPCFSAKRASASTLS